MNEHPQSGITEQNETRWVLTGFFLFIVLTSGLFLFPGVFVFLYSQVFLAPLPAAIVILIVPGVLLWRSRMLRK